MSSFLTTALKLSMVKCHQLQHTISVINVQKCYLKILQRSPKQFACFQDPLIWGTHVFTAVRIACVALGVSSWRGRTTRRAQIIDPGLWLRGSPQFTGLVFGATGKMDASKMSQQNLVLGRFTEDGKMIAAQVREAPSFGTDFLGSWMTVFV